MTTKSIYRMSQAGKCPRALTAERLGYKPEEAPPWLSLSAREGKRHEEWIIEDLRSEFNVSNQQREITINRDIFTLVGHIDGEVNSRGSGASLLEIKSMSQFEFDRWMKGRFIQFPKYAVQITCYMTACKMDKVLYIVKNRSSGYIDRQWITEPPANIEVILSKLELVEQAVKENRLCEVEYDYNEIECRRCNYSYLCVPKLKDLTILDGQALLDAAGIWREGKALETKANEYISQAKEMFEVHLLASGLKKIQFDDLVISEQKGRVSYPIVNLLKIVSQEALDLAKKTGEPFITIRDVRKEVESL